MQTQKIFYSQIEQATCAHFRIGRADLRSKGAQRALSYPRTIIVALARHHTRLSYPQLGMKLNRDHTTMMHADERAKILLAESEEFRANFVAVEKLLIEGPPAPLDPVSAASILYEDSVAKAWRASLPKIPYVLPLNSERAL